MPNYLLDPDSDALHGDYSCNRAPVLRIKSGDTIEARILDAGWGLEAPHLDGTPRKRHPSHQAQIQRGHALIGPIWIEGAQPEMTLVIRFEKIIPGDYGFTYAGAFTTASMKAFN
jgi:acetamidase/formamidase